MKSARFLAVIVLLSVSDWVFAQGPVYFADSNLKAAVEAQLGVSDPNAADMLGLTELIADYRGITDLTGIESATNLIGLSLGGNQVGDEDLSSLSGLTSLVWLYLPWNQITDVSPLSGLNNLEWLLLGHNQISDISPLSGLTNLEWLYLAENQITDVSPLSGLNNLTRLLLSKNQISDLSPLSGLTGLDRLLLDENQVSDVSPLSGLTNLTRLYLHLNPVSDISVVSGMTQLQWLFLQYTQVSDISILSGLTELRRLSLNNTQISDVSALTHMYYLHYLYLDGSPLSLEACSVQIPQIIANNPGLTITHDCQAETQYSLIISSGPGGTVTSPGEGSFSYADGTSVSVVAIADAGYHFVNWTGTAVDAGKVGDPSAASTSMTVDGDYTLVANFAVNGANQYTVTVNSTAGGSTDQDGVHTVNEGDTLVINPTPAVGHNFIGWSGSASGLADPLTVIVTSDMTITANFSINHYTVTVNSIAGGSTDQDGVHTVNHGDTLVINPTPAAGHSFTGWSGSVSGLADPLTVTVTSNMTITANFSTNQYTVTVSSTAGGSTDQDGSHTVNYGDTLVISATPDTGYSFIGWSGSASGSADPLTVTVTSSMAITANFAIIQHTVTVSSTAGGSTDQDGSHTVNHGDTLTVTPSAGTGYVFTGWTGAASGTANPLVVTVTSAMSIVANFERTVKPPVVVTYPARFVGQTSATLMGYIPNDGGEADYEYRFVIWKEGESEPTSGDQHYSTWKAKTSLNGSSTFTSDLPEGDRLVLESGTTYNYLAIGRNSAGSARGGIRQFTTLPPLYVDDNAPGDPGPHDASISDPLEDGTKAHPFDSIQEAIGTAHQHDTVVVIEGTYHEVVNLMGKNIDLTGFDPSIPEMTSYPVIDANGMGTVVTFDHGEDSGCVLSGFVLTGGYNNPAGAILCDGSSPDIRNCLIVGNRCPDPNFAEPNGGAVFCVGSNSVFEHCTIAGNYAGKNGVGLYSVDSHLTVVNSIVWGNLPEQIQIESGDDPTILYSDIQGTWPGLGNIAEDPNFVQPGYWADPADPWLLPTDPANPPVLWIEGDYRLTPGSPCIGAGDANWAILGQPYYYRKMTDMGVYQGFVTP